MFLTLRVLQRPKSRTREVSEPFPPSQSVSVVHRVTLPQPQNQAPNTAPLPSGHFSPVLINSPINSPSVDSQAEFDAAERSDSSLGTEDGSTTTSVEIISTCLDDSELSMRLNGSLSIGEISILVVLNAVVDTVPKQMVPVPVECSRGPLMETPVLILVNSLDHLFRGLHRPPQLQHVKLLRTFTHHFALLLLSLHPPSNPKHT